MPPKVNSHSMWIHTGYLLGLIMSFVNSSLASVSNQTATVIFAGDISFDGPVKYFTEVKKSCNYTSPFEKVRNFMTDADLRVANLESPLVQECNPKNVGLKGKVIHHCGAVRSVEGLKFAGFDLIQLANNHFADYGNKGMKSTMKTLKDAGIDFVGVTENDNGNEGQRPVIKTINGINIGFLAYCQNIEGCEIQKTIYKRGPAVYGPQRARNDIKKLQKSADIIVILMHWGSELLPAPSTRERRIAKHLELIGANLVIGGHPHVVQSHECLGKAMVVYSLGNFLFPKYGKSAVGRMLGGKTPSSKDVDEYVKGMNYVFNPSQFSYMFRVKFSRNGILDADYLQLEIKDDPKTNCLQPTPIINRWEKFCRDKDFYCYKLDFLHPPPNAHEVMQSKSRPKVCLLNVT